MKFLAPLTLSFCLSLLVGCATHTKPVTAANYIDKGFTPWLSEVEIHAYFDPLDVKDAQGKNYWDHKHWLTANKGVGMTVPLNSATKLPPRRPMGVTAGIGMWIWTRTPTTTT